MRWHAKQLETPTWWQELSEVPSQMDVQEFVGQVQASLQLPKVSSHAQEVTNDSSVLLTPQSLDWDQFLPLFNMRFGGQDYPKRPWHMPRLCSIGWKKPSCHHWVSLANWQRVCWSSGEPWNLKPHSPMLRFWKMPCPLTGSRLHPPRHWRPCIPQPLGNENVTGAIGLGPEVHSQWLMV